MSKKNNNLQDSNFVQPFGKKDSGDGEFEDGGALTFRGKKDGDDGEIDKSGGVLTFRGKKDGGDGEIDLPENFQTRSFESTLDLTNDSDEFGLNFDDDHEADSDKEVKFPLRGEQTDD